MITSSALPIDADSRGNKSVENIRIIKAKQVDVNQFRQLVPRLSFKHTLSGRGKEKKK